MMLRKAAICLLIILNVCTVSCNKRKNVRPADSQSKGISIISKAERFSVVRNDSFTVVAIFDPWQGAEDVRHEYYLVRRGRKAPVTADPSRIIPVPVRKIICMSSTHLAMISALGEQRSIAGISGTNYIYNEVLKSRSDSGYISEVGYDSEVNEEVILQTDPDLIMMYGIGIESAGYFGKISELGIKIMIDADYLETDPLGKAEWIKVFGALYCKENLADSIFDSTVKSYNDIKTFISKNTVSRPSVLLGLPFRDTWFISPGNSYISTLISDAGGKYL
jgi:iron complex transport system substrate-binding protein